MNMTMLIYVAIGGAVGAAGRYSVGVAVSSWLGHGFPFATMIVNVVGSLVLGAVIELSALVWSPSMELRGMIVIGLLGAFTTFSAFSLDVVTLISRNEILSAVIYVGVSVIASVGALWVGMAMTKAIVS